MSERTPPETVRDDTIITAYAESIAQGQQHWLYHLENRFQLMPRDDLRTAHEGTLAVGRLLQRAHETDGYMGDKEMLHLIGAIREEIEVELGEEAMSAALEPGEDDGDE